MAIFLQILEGASPAEAEPILATGDIGLISSVARELSRRLGVEPPSRVLRLMRQQQAINPKEPDA